ncbi:MAG: PQQ-like beta-propeller repeat protein [Verrucomicrobia bacterium]|nr:PQQ-like beta-propeller repeat protein [Verrucomicrobiota bacterium]
MEAVPPPPVPAARQGHRFWFPLSVGIVAALALGAIELRPELERGPQFWLRFAVVLLALVLSLVWFVFLSRLPWRVRLLTVAVLAAVGLGLTLALRVDGTVDGRSIPRLAWKWSAHPERVFSPRSTPPRAETAPPPALLKDVPQFFGPRRDGVVTGVGLARDWTKSPPRELWRQPIGTGWSAFAVVGDRAYTQEQRGEEEWVSCYDVLSGRLLWSHARRARFFQWQAGEGPHATPTVDRGRVFAYGATGILDCLDAATGAPVWSRAVLEENKLENLEWGASSSPLLVADLVIVTGGQTAGPTVLAYDRQTGEPKWRSGTDRASYSSPIAATLAGTSVVLSFNAATLTAHDLATGTVLLSHRWGSDKAPKAAQPIAVGGDRIFVTSGYGMGCELLQITAGAGGKLSAESIWKNIRLKAQFNSVAMRNGFFYGLDDGFLACVEIATGTRRWKGGLYGSGQTLLADDLILVQTERGPVVLAEANPESFRELGRIAALSSKTWNHPTLAGRYLLVRNDREAVCYELPVAGATSAANQRVFSKQVFPVILSAAKNPLGHPRLTKASLLPLDSSRRSDDNQV